MQPKTIMAKMCYRLTVAEICSYLYNNLSNSISIYEILQKRSKIGNNNSTRQGHDNNRKKLIMITALN